MSRESNPEMYDENGVSKAYLAKKAFEQLTPEEQARRKEEKEQKKAEAHARWLKQNAEEDRQREKEQNHYEEFDELKREVKLLRKIEEVVRAMPVKHQGDLFVIDSYYAGRLEEVLKVKSTIKEFQEDEECN
jgi:ABC-type branched-subunit amino acid transport system ATPase component